MADHLRFSVIRRSGHANHELVQSTGQVGAWSPVGAGNAPRAGDRWVELDGRHDRHWQPGDQASGVELGDAVLMRRVGKGRAGRLLDGRTWDQFPSPAGAARALTVDEMVEQTAFAVDEGLV